jgi:hypothetical protein
MFYAILFPALAVLVVAGYRLFHLRRHDRVLQRFWGARRRALQFLQENEDNLSQETYAEIRELVAFLDDKIENYEARKQDLFNLRTADLSKDDVKAGLEFIDKSEKQDEELQALYGHTALAMGAAFYAYTPFTILIPITMVVLLLAGLGVHVARKTARLVYRYADRIIHDDPYRGHMRPTLRPGV